MRVTPGSQPSDQRSRETRDPTGNNRVLMIAPTSFFADYGCHVRILEEAKVLQGSGYRVTIVTYHNGDPVPGLDIRRTMSIPWRRHYEVGSSRHKIALDVFLGMKTFELIARHRFDIIHAHLHEGALIGLVMGRLFRVPVVFDFQGSLTGEMLDHRFLKRQGVAYRFFRWLETQIDRRSAAILTSSSQAARLLVEQFGCLPERIHPLPDCVNAETFKPASAYDPAALASLRARLGIPSDRKLIVYLGLLAEYQGTGLLLEAMQRVLKVREDVHLALMGFPNLAVYQQRAAELGISQHVTFTGRVPYAQAPIHLALGDVAVAPKLSLTEGAGKLLNYMAVGLPVVAFDTPVASEYLGGDGILAVRGDAESLAASLLGCLFPRGDVSDRCSDMGRRLRRRALQNYSWDSAGQQIGRVYGKLVRDGLRQAAPARSGALPR